MNNKEQYKLYIKMCEKQLSYINFLAKKKVLTWDELIYYTPGNQRALGTKKNKNKLTDRDKDYIETSIKLGYNIKSCYIVLKSDSSEILKYFNYVTKKLGKSK